jgi:hypothetical protein
VALPSSRSKASVDLDLQARKGGMFVTSVLRPRDKRPVSRSEQQNFELPTIRSIRADVLCNSTLPPARDCLGRPSAVDLPASGCRGRHERMNRMNKETGVYNLKDSEVTLSTTTSNAHQFLLRPLLAACMLALVAGCGNGTLGNNAAVSVDTVVGGGSSSGGPCTGTGLAAVDLSGQCRVATTTPGALEAVDGSVTATAAGVSLTTANAAIAPVNVAWQPAPDPVAGYVIYYGPTPDTASVLLSDLSTGSYDPAAPSASYDPARDLGMSSGGSVCFNIFAYDTARALSSSPQLVCTTV